MVIMMVMIIRVDGGQANDGWKYDHDKIQVLMFKRVSKWKNVAARHTRR